MSKAKELAKTIREEGNNYYFSPSLRQLVDAVLLEAEKEKELQEWKAKAMPLLRGFRHDVTNKLAYGKMFSNEYPLDDAERKFMTKIYKTLNELLGE